MDSQLPQTPTPLPELPPGHNHLQKFHALIAMSILVGVTALIGTWFWYNANNVEEYLPAYTPRLETETSDWKTYRNEEYGFEFKYPADWKYQSIEKRSSGYYIAKVFNDEFVLNILSKSYEGIKPERLFGANLADGAPVNGNVYYWCKNLGCESEDVSKPKIILVSLSGTELAEELDLELSFNRAREDTAIEIFQQIFSTFKFIEPAVSASPTPTVWKTHNSERYAFELQYPSDWNYELIEKRTDAYYVARFYNQKFELTVFSGSIEGVKLYKTAKAVLSNGQEVNMEFYYPCKNLGCAEVDFNKPFIYPFAITQSYPTTLPEGLDLKFSFNPKDEREAETVFREILSTFKYR